MSDRCIDGFKGFCPMCAERANRPTPRIFDAMLDLETFSSDHDAVVISLGAVKIDMPNRELGSTFYAVLPTWDQHKAGRRCNPETVSWWLTQSDAARGALKVTTHATTLDVLDGFARFMTGVRGLWGNGSDFDNAVLRSLYGSFELAAPWNYRQNRCFRTVRALAGSPEPKREGEHHNALDDAMHQARWLLSMTDLRV